MVEYRQIEGNHVEATAEPPHVKVRVLERGDCPTGAYPEFVVLEYCGYRRELKGRFAFLENSQKHLDVSSLSPSCRGDHTTEFAPL
jgi:hypothetical protein